MRVLITVYPNHCVPSQTLLGENVFSFPKGLTSLPQQVGSLHAPLLRQQGLEVLVWTHRDVALVQSLKVT